MWYLFQGYNRSYFYFYYPEVENIKYNTWQTMHENNVHMEGYDAVQQANRRAKFSFKGTIWSVIFCLNISNLC